MKASILASAAGISLTAATAWAPALTAAMEKFSINTPRRQAAFIAQVAHESNGFESLVENLNYRSDKLVGVFGAQRISQALADQLGRTDARKANQEGIANAVYGGVWGKANLGNFEPGDGWKFRGRGLIQLTGRMNYDNAGKALGLDLVNKPDQVATPDVAAMTAAWFWNKKNLNGFADIASTKAITKAINGGDLGLADREARYASALQVLTA